MASHIYPLPQNPGSHTPPLRPDGRMECVRATATKLCPISPHPNNSKAILILLGTNDFNSGVPLGEWYQTAEEDVNRRGVTIRQPRRHFAKNMGTFRGRINTVMEYLKHNFPSQQIVLMIPLHRGYANFGGSNVQPAECFPIAASLRALPPGFKEQ